MHIPPFSIFSAVSELFVTAGVLYVIQAVGLVRAARRPATPAGTVTA